MNAYVNLIVFIIITGVYFIFGKKEKSSHDSQNETKINMYYLLFYFLATLVSQMILNVIYISQLCNGSINDNIGAGSLLAFIPWFLIFGCVLIVIFMFPGLKSVFSNIIGYLVVSSQANKLLGNLLENQDIEQQIQKVSGENEKIELKKTAELILKMCSDKSIIINEMNPLNFNSMFDSLKVLFKNPNQNYDTEKQELKKLIIRKDCVGEFCWYLYTAIFLTSVVSYNTASRGCSKSIATMKNNYSQYEDASQKIQETNSIKSSQLYT